MHWAFDTGGTINEAANEGATTVRAAIFNSVDDTVQVEERDLDIVDFDELSPTRRQFLKLTSFAPALGFHL